MPKDNGKPKYICCNSDESEPGTFKDRQIIEKDPHQLIEGLIIGAYAMGVNTVCIYIRGEYVSQAKILQKANKDTPLIFKYIDEMKATGVINMVSELSFVPVIQKPNATAEIKSVI
jgi:NADH:ubiquinone oxidoreductase subunit F (NADH-binding)